MANYNTHPVCLPQRSAYRIIRVGCAICSTVAIPNYPLKQLHWTNTCTASLSQVEALSPALRFNFYFTVLWQYSSVPLWNTVLLLLVPYYFPQMLWRSRFFELFIIDYTGMNMGHETVRAVSRVRLSDMHIASGLKRPSCHSCWEQLSLK